MQGETPSFGGDNAEKYRAAEIGDEGASEENDHPEMQSVLETVRPDDGGVENERDHE